MTGFHVTQSGPSTGSCVPSTRRPEYGRPTEVARCHSTGANSVSRASVRAAGVREEAPWRRTGASGTSERAPSSRNVRLGGSACSGPASAPCPPLPCRNTAIGSIVADPRTSATAGTVRVASRRRRAACAVSRRCRDASSPVAIGMNSAGPSPSAATAGTASASSAKGLRGCSRNQSTSVSSHTSPNRQPIDRRPSRRGRRVLRP